MSTTCAMSVQLQPSSVEFAKRNSYAAENLSWTTARPRVHAMISLHVSITSR